MLVRLLWHSLTSRFRRPISPLGPTRSRFRVLPTHLDLFLHVNNAIYFKLMDRARIDLLGRAGLISKLRQRNWNPVVVAQTIRFRRPLTLFQRIEIVTRVIDCDDQALVLEQIFMRRNEVVAQALVRVRCLSADGPVPTAAVMSMAGNPTISGPVPAYASRWNIDQASLPTPSFAVE